MPSVSGQAITQFQVSPTSNDSDYVDVSTDVVDTVTYNKGRVQEDRTRGGDTARRFDDLKPNPSLQFFLDIDDDAGSNWDLLMLPDTGTTWFRITVGRTTVSGSGTIEGPTWTYNSANGVYQQAVTIRPRGQRWVEGRTA